MLLQQRIEGVAVDLWHEQVTEDDRIALRAQMFPRQRPIARRRHHVALTLQQCCQGSDDAWFVIDNQNRRRW